VNIAKLPSVPRQILKPSGRRYYPLCLSVQPANPVEIGVNPMRNQAWLAAVAIVVLVGSPARADDKSACLAGITAIKAAIARHPPKPVLDRLQQALDSAAQEEIESDWNECVAAIRTAKLPKK
jgi:hypothetical protein